MKQCVWGQLYFKLESLLCLLHYHNFLFVAAWRLIKGGQREREHKTPLMEIKREGQGWENRGIIARLMNADRALDEQLQCLPRMDERRARQVPGTNQTLFSGKRAVSRGVGRTKSKQNQLNLLASVLIRILLPPHRHTTQCKLACQNSFFLLSFNSFHCCSSQTSSSTVLLLQLTRAVYLLLNPVTHVEIQPIGPVVLHLPIMINQQVILL